MYFDLHVYHIEDTFGLLSEHVHDYIMQQQSKKIEFHMPTELSQSQSVTESHKMVTVAYIGEREGRPTDGDDVPVEAAPTSVMAPTSSYLHAVEDTMVVMPGTGEEMEHQAESEQFITLAELTANRMSEEGMVVLNYYLCILVVMWLNGHHSY